ncbi:MAG: DUF3015 family protein [Nitrospiraceae bacterium]
MRPFSFFAAACALIAMGTTACTIRATIKQTTDTTSNITATTSGRTWFTEDGQFKPDYKAQAFVLFNADNLQQDLSRGHGEYLSSLSVLLDIPEPRRAEFFDYAQTRYSLGSVDRKNPDDTPARLTQRWSAPTAGREDE